MDGLKEGGYDRLRAALTRGEWLASLSDTDLVRFALEAEGHEQEDAEMEMMVRLAPDLFDLP